MPLNKETKPNFFKVIFFLFEYRPLLILIILENIEHI